MKSSLTQTFGQWMRETREKKNWTISQCAEKAGIKWQAWQRLENDEPTRRDGSPTQPTRATVLKITAALEGSPKQALQAAGLSSDSIEEQPDDQALRIQVVYDNLDPADQEDLLHLALLKWRRRHPEISPYSLAAAARPEQQVGEFLCLDLRTGSLLSAAAIQSTLLEGEYKERLIELLLRLLTWQEDRSESAQDITHDLSQIRQLLDGRAAVTDGAGGGAQINKSDFNRMLD